MSEPDATGTPPVASRTRRGGFKSSQRLQAEATDIVGLILAVGICTALNVITAAVMWDALTSDSAGISENATQILTGWGGGIIGVIGALVGYRLGKARGEASITAGLGATPTIPDPTQP